ncbi:hypothetical protein BDW60DRAFT_201838 [Aspergillus nidulans var. acristatus]
MVHTCNHRNFNKPVYVGFVEDDNEVIDQKRNSIKLHEQRGDLFDAPERSFLIHACNCIGTWSAGVAKGFMQRFPKAYAEYRKVCNTSNPLGTCLIIPDTSSKGIPYYVVCLFTSTKYGKFKDSPKKIIDNTKKAMKDFLRQIEEMEDTITDIRMPKINSKNFNVPWNDTKQAIESIESSCQYNINVIDLNF